MNHSPFWPLVWKEYRAGRAFWLSMAAMGFVAQAGVRLLARPTPERDWWLYGIALMISAGFAVGVGGTLFAVEHEERTFGLLRVLPLRAKQLGWAKLLCALAGLGLLVVALWFTASAMAGWQRLSSGDAGQLWGLWGLACAEGLAWGILCSLVIRSPLWATVVAVMGVTLAIQAAVTLTNAQGLNDLPAYSKAIPLRIIVLLAVAALDAWLLPRWLQGQFPRTLERRAPKSEATAQSPDGWESPAPRWAAPLGRLMWQTWSETLGSAWWLLGFFLAGLLICAVVIAVLITGTLDFGQMYVWPPQVNAVRLTPFYVLAPLVLLTALAGSLTFSLDRNRRAQFLSERGISPRLVWLSRQIVWGGWLSGLLFVAVVLTVVPWLVPPPRFASAEPGRENWYALGSDSVYYGGLVNIRTQSSLFRAATDDVAINAWLLWAALLSSYAVAQLVSMLVRRRLLAAVLAAPLSVLAAGWAHLMFVLDVPWWWSVLPLPIACLLATWLAASAWLFARASWRQLLTPAVVIAAAIACIAIIVPRYRVDEIPATTVEWPQQDESPTAIADTKAAIEGYQRAYDLFRAGPEPGTERDAYREQLAQAIVQVAEHRTVWLPSDPKESWQVFRKIHELGQWLNTWGAKCQERGELDKALDAYLTALRVAEHADQCRFILPSPTRDPSVRDEALIGLCSWAALPEQTSERIRAAIRRLQEVQQLQTSPANRLLPWYAAVALTIRDVDAALNAVGVLPGIYASSDRWIASQLPWERERSLRLLNLITSIALKSVSGLDKPLGEKQGFHVAPLFEHDWEGSLYVAAEGYHLEQFPQWLRTTPLLEDRDLARLDPSWFFASDETNYRATLISLALEAWRMDHGQFPDRLDELVPSELATLPVDPVLGAPFLYFPHGLNEAGAGKTGMHNRWLLYSPEGRPAASESQTESSTETEVKPPVPWSIYAPFDAAAIYDHPLLWSALAMGPDESRVTFAYNQDGSKPIGYLVRSEKYPWSYETGIFAAGRSYLIPQLPEKQP